MHGSISWIHGSMHELLDQWTRGSWIHGPWIHGSWINGLGILGSLHHGSMDHGSMDPCSMDLCIHRASLIYGFMVLDKILEVREPIIQSQDTPPMSPWPRLVTRKRIMILSGKLYDTYIARMCHDFWKRSMVHIAPGSLTTSLSHPILPPFYNPAIWNSEREMRYHTRINVINVGTIYNTYFDRQCVIICFQTRRKYK